MIKNFFLEISYMGFGLAWQAKINVIGNILRDFPSSAA